jgi:hypothetical protein
MWLKIATVELDSLTHGFIKSSWLLLHSREIANVEDDAIRNVTVLTLRNGTTRLATCSLHEFATVLDAREMS